MRDGTSQTSGCVSHSVSRDQLHHFNSRSRHPSHTGFYGYTTYSVEACFHSIEPNKTYSLVKSEHSARLLEEIIPTTSVPPGALFSNRDGHQHSDTLARAGALPHNIRQYLHRFLVVHRVSPCAGLIYNWVPSVHGQHDC